MLIYKVESNLPDLYARNLDEVADFIRHELEGAYVDVHAVLCTVSLVEMTEKEVSELPEWEP